MILAIKKVFGIPFFNSGQATGSASAETKDSQTGTAVAAKMPSEHIKMRMELALHDIKTSEADRLRYRIRAATTPHALWMLRSDLYQSISKQHSQTEAAHRINHLLPCFAHWIAAHQLTPV